MIRFYKWQKHHEMHQSSDEQKEEQIETDNQEDIYLHKKLDDMDNVRHALAVDAVARFFVETIPLSSGTTAVAACTPLFHKSQILKEAHGVAVWALSSNPGDSVQYHMDYAELLRYEFNVTVPPLWAGTLQCSALWNDDQSSSSDNQCDLSQCNTSQNSMRGGEFCVNLRGLEHYAEHGYKGNLSGDPMGGWKRPDDAVTGRCLSGRVHIDDSQWVTIPYAFNRGIVHRGELPHLSAPIECIGAQDKSSLEGDDNCTSPPLSRVIVGFNVFGHDVGARIAKAPEHSKPFRRKVRLYRSTINTCTNKNMSDGKKSCQKGMDLSQLRKNKGLTKLLVLAKREKVKEELRRNQEQLSCRIWRRMLSHHGQDRPLLQVADLAEEFGHHNDGLDGVWPKTVDVHVQLHHMILSTTRTQDVAQQERSPMHIFFEDSDGLAGSPGTRYYIQAVVTPLDSTIEKHKESLRGGLIPLLTSLDIAECKE
mmetsp:Transcript_19769/g.42933  ORF Transcript_19769/g.42933 Transcript_19769/m.42933 type:complete len:479 (+) Transcript_19769:9-1445(+)